VYKKNNSGGANHESTRLLNAIADDNSFGDLVLPHGFGWHVLGGVFLEIVDFVFGDVGVLPTDDCAIVVGISIGLIVRVRFRTALATDLARNSAKKDGTINKGVNPLEHAGQI
jgi:hypothetical protein